MLRGAVLAGVVAMAATSAARAQPFPPATDRDFALDLYTGTVLGSIRSIGMGGASVALVEQASGMGANPVAPAVREATSNDWWDIDASLDWLNPGLGNDLDNNGDDDGGKATVLTLGVALELKHTGIGLDGTITVREIGDIEINSEILRLLVAQSFADDVYTFGIGVRGGQFRIASEGKDLLEATGWSPTAGFLWRPKQIDLRLGGAFSLPASADVPECAACGDRILPAKVRLPWELSFGGAWRFAPTRWNQQVTSEFRDERALTVAADVVLVGAMVKGRGLQRWAEAGELQRSGDSVEVSVRAGVDYEWIPGWLRVRGGSYWEPGRLEGRSGRVHGTGGVEVRLFGFHVLGAAYRVRISLTLDLAHEYGNGGLSLGFW
jgi:hypothetical protein